MFDVPARVLSTKSSAIGAAVVFIGLEKEEFASGLSEKCGTVISQSSINVDCRGAEALKLHRYKKRVGDSRVGELGDRLELQAAPVVVRGTFSCKREKTEINTAAEAPTTAVGASLPKESMLLLSCK